MKLVDYCLKNFESWGEGCNFLQDLAEDVLTKEEFDTFLIKAHKDYNKCEFLDGILFNGDYYDWKEFETKETEILNSFLKYFTDTQIERLEQAL